MIYRAIGIKSGTVYATGSYPECIRQVNQQKHDEATKIIRANETYTPTTAEEETARLAKEWQFAELLKRQRAEAEKAAQERKAQAEAAVEVKKQLKVERMQQAAIEAQDVEPPKKTRGEWSYAEEAFVKANMNMPRSEMIDELERRFGKVVTISALNNRKYKLRNQYDLPARPAIPWTQEDDDYIIKHYHRLTAQIIEKEWGS